MICGDTLKLYYKDKNVKLYLGNARDLSEIRTESIDLIITSPPYWGKRDYGEEVIAIWGGEPGCQHIWADAGRITVGSNVNIRGAGEILNPVGIIKKVGEKDRQQKVKAGSFCSLCGCWRGSLGLEPTWQLYIEHLCECAREWWRVLKPTGNLFINIGDTFATHTSKRSAQFGGDLEDGRNEPFTSSRPRQNCSEKMKLGIPYRLRFALNDMGWMSRDDIIWYKGKEYPDGDISKVAMPESVKRRFACSYEMVLRFVKTPKMNYYVNETTLESRDRPPKERIEGQDFEWREHARCEGNGCDSPRCKDGLIKYSFWHGVDQWFDLDAVRKPMQANSIQRFAAFEKNKEKFDPAWHKEAQKSQGPMAILEHTVKARAKTANERAFKPEGTLRQAPEPGEPHAFHPGGSNPGDVWIIQPEPFKLPHYAVFPSKLCERMILVGCPKEVCPKCGKPRERIMQGVRGGSSAPHDKEKYASGSEFLSGKTTLRLEKKTETIGWSDCGCERDGYVPGIVLDPFCGGSGRAARMARKLGRRFIGIDLKEDYLEMSRECYLQDEIEQVKKQMEMGARQEVLL